MISAFPIKLTLTSFWSFCIEVDVSHNVELPKPDKRVTNLDNPSEIIKQAQKEIVINNSSYKEDDQKAPQQKGNECLECMQLHAVRPV